MLCDDLNKIRRKVGESNAGTLSFDVVLMFKIPKSNSNMSPTDRSQKDSLLCEPCNRVLQAIDDMGAFLAEYSGNTAYRMQVFSSRFCGCCCILMAVIIVAYCRSAIALAAVAKPGEIPDWFYLSAWGAMIGLPLFIFLMLFSAARRNRKSPLLFGLFEKGFVVVLRNKTYRTFFWNDIRRIRYRTQGKKQSRIMAVGVEAASPEFSPDDQTECVIRTEYFRNSEKLCRHILDSSPHAEKAEITPNHKRRIILAIIVIVVIAVSPPLIELFGQRWHARGSVSTKWQIESQMTGETMHFSVYLPPGYWQELQNGRRYPVLYLLHGFRDDHTSWPRHGELRRIVDETRTSGKSRPMIIVMPHALGGYYGNRDGYRYEDYFFTELIPFVEQQFNVRADKEHRAIAGISMGGQGAFYYAMKYPELFASCCPMGGAFHFPDGIAESHAGEQNDIPADENDLSALLLKTAERHNADVPDETSDERSKTFVRFYFDCGEQDGLVKINRALDDRMTELGIPHELRTRPGGHAWECWRDALPEVLEFVSATF